MGSSPALKAEMDFKRKKGKRNSRVLVSHTEASPVALFTEISLSTGSDK